MFGRLLGSLDLVCSAPSIESCPDLSEKQGLGQNISDCFDADLCPQITLLMTALLDLHEGAFNRAHCMCVQVSAPHTMPLWSTNRRPLLLPQSSLPQDFLSLSAA